MKEKIELTFPEWAFLDAHSHKGNELGSKTVILHVRSASVIEVLDGEFFLKEDALSLQFKSYLGEQLTFVLHYCATLDQKNDQAYIIENIIKPCAKWYDDYSKWEDGNTLEMISNQN